MSTGWKVLIGVLLGAVTAWMIQGWRLGAEIAEKDAYAARLSASYSDQMATFANNARDGESAARIEEQRRAAAQQQVIQNARQQTYQAMVDRDAADAVAGRLRKRVDDIAAAARRRPGSGNPSLTAGSPTAADPIGVLADVLSRADERAGILAAYADQARIAGVACERAYESLGR